MCDEKRLLSIFVGILLVLGIVKCGNNPTPTPTPPIPTPKVSSSQIGTPALAGHTYSWSPVDGLDNPNVAQPIASPKKTTEYTVTAATICGASTSKTTVHVFATNASGELVEVK